MKRRWALSVFACLVACGALVAGCGDDDGDDGNGGDFVPCSSTFTPCGGDPTGAWTLAGTCNALAPFTAMCGEMVVTVTRDGSTGTDTFGADNNYTLDVSYDLDFTAVVPKTCLMGQGCDFLPAMDATFKSCTDQGENCDCNGTYVDTFTESGTWRMEGTNLMTTASGATTEEATAICISGSIGESLDGDGVRFQWRR